MIPLVKEAIRLGAASAIQGSSSTSVFLTHYGVEPLDERSRFVFCRRTDQVSDVWAIMKERRLKNIPVADAASIPIGVLNARDALEVLLTEVEQEETLLRDYVMCVGYR
jgi:CBS domain-containing protein